MDNGTNASGPLSAARQELAGLLHAIERARAEFDEVSAQQCRLDSLKRAEASARAKVDEIRQRNARALSEQLLNPAGSHVTVDHKEQTQFERELVRATREADVARACEPEVGERFAAANRRLAELIASVEVRSADVALEESAKLVREIDADAVKLRAKYARLWGLREFLAEAKLYRPLERAPAAVHPDNVCPSVGEVHRTAPIWKEFAARLAANPTARLEVKE